MMLEILGLIARVALGVLYEVLCFWSPSERPSSYGDYLKKVRAGTAPLTKRQWKDAGKPEQPGGTDGTP